MAVKQNNQPIPQEANQMAVKQNIMSNTGEPNPEDFPTAKEYMIAMERRRISQRVQIFVPREAGGDSDQEICINGRNYQIQRGKVVNVPGDVADVLLQSQYQLEKANEKIDSAVNATK